MWNNTKVKGFSIIEVLASIIISGVVIGSAYSGYIYAHGNFQRFNQLRKDTRTYFELSAIMTNEMENAAQIIKIGDRKILLTQENNNIEYTFNAEHITRIKNNQLDTFFFPVERVEVSTISNTLVNYVQIEIVDKKRYHPLSFYKSYGAAATIEN